MDLGVYKGLDIILLVSGKGSGSSIVDLTVEA